MWAQGVSHVAEEVFSDLRLAELAEVCVISVDATTGLV